MAGGKSWAGWVVGLFFAMIAVQAHAAPLSTPPAPDAAHRCADLAKANFGDIQDAPTQVVTATYYAATPKRVAYCDVEGYVAPTIGFGLWLPADNWNRKYIVRGCGGFCGSVAMELACPQHLRDGYACLHTDMGHKSTMLDAKWAYNDLQAEVDFGYRATHVVTLAGKAISAAFYSQAPRYSYFMACSTGGRQGMVEAERFPYDFDGIVAIAPVVDETGAGIQLLWSTRVNRDASGKEILTADKIPALHAAVVADCDMNDGIKDGLIGDPRLCKFDPAKIQCKGVVGPTCLTPAQVAVVRDIYRGPYDSHGQPLYTGGAQPGSELNWIGSYISKDGEVASYANMQAELWRYMGFWPDPGPSWKTTDFNFDKDPKRVGMMEAIYSGSNPDLRKFKRAGAKLIIAQGWADQSVTPLNTVDYFETATRTMGGRDQMAPFARLFTVAGMNHCSMGEGAYGINYIAALERWVEKGQAPAKLIGVHPKDPASLDYFGIDTDRLTPDQIAFSRPYFPYPAGSVYSGHGNPNAADSYVPN